MKKSILALLITGSLFTMSCEKETDKRELLPETEQSTEKKKGLEVHQTFRLNEEQSVAEWFGAGPGASHTGSFAVSSTDIKVVNNKIKEGSFIFPIASIKNFDLPEEVKPVLLNHLKSPDFFNMAVYPEASFTISRVNPLPKPTEGAVEGANYNVTGNFILLGVTNEISVPARIEFQGEELAVEATFSIDRTKWGMSYGADPSLGDHHIYPEVKMHLKLKGNRQ